MLRHEDDLLDLAGVIHLAAADPDPTAWPGALERLSDVLQRAGVLVVDHEQPETVHELIHVRLPPETPGYILGRARHGEVNPLVRALPFLPVGTLLTPDQSMGGTGFAQTAPDHEYMQPADFVPLGAAVLDRDGPCTISMAIARDTASPRLLSREAKLLERLLPHLAGAALVRRRLAVALAASEAPRALVGLLDRGVFLLDAAARLGWANPTAQHFLSRRDGLAVDRAGMVVAAKPGETSALRRLVATAAAAGAGVGLEAGGALSLSRPSGGRPWVVRVVPLAPEIGLAGMPRQLPRRPEAALLVGDPDEIRAPSGELLVQAYGLSRAEAALAARLVEGASLREAANALAISENTAKTQLKAVFAKLDVDRQTALVRRVLADLGGLAVPSPARNGNGAEHA
jgi:DNA-binding CsgD family transcriptional regulator